MSTEITFDGLEEIDEHLAMLLDEARVKAALGKACALVERSAKQKAPKGNGDLQRSITSKVVNDGTEQIGIVFTPLEYAPYVEYGTGLFAEGGKGRKEVPWVYVEGSTRESHTKKVYTPQEAAATAAFLESKGLEAVVTYGEHPHPYLRPALHENREKIKRILKESLTND